MLATTTPILLSMLLAADGGTIAPALPSSGLGGVSAPAALGPGTVALYGVLGAPELAVGYRQGFAPLEVEARFAFNLFEVSGLLEAGAKVGLLRHDRFQVAAGGMLGLKANSGATYFDLRNFPSWALRPAVLGLLTYEISDLIALLARVDIPLTVSFSVKGIQFTPTVGLGAEADLGQGVSLLVLGKIGVDVRSDPSGYTSTQAAWAIQLGVGYRAF
jgi:hypothetical protein